MLSAFIENLNADSTRVYSPKPYFLLCGGPVSSIVDPHPISLRDAFLRAEAGAAIKNAEILQIEEIQEYFEKDCPYKDLVEFERDIAQISDMVLLFSESPGSFTELGSFSSYKEIYEKLLVVVQSKYLTKSSFILKGPVTFLRRKYKNSVFSITNGQVGIKGISFSSVKPEVLLSVLKSPINERLLESKGRTTFQKNRFSHRCKLYIALLKEFSVLKDEELKILFGAFGVKLSDALLDRIAFCCKCVRWSGTSQAGFDRVHFALNGNEAAKFELNGEYADKLRRRVEIRQHWIQTDPARIDAHAEAVGL